MIFFYWLYCFSWICLDRILTFCHASKFLLNFFLRTPAAGNFFIGKDAVQVIEMLLQDNNVEQKTETMVDEAGTTLSLAEMAKPTLLWRNYNGTSLRV